MDESVIDLEKQIHKVLQCGGPKYTSRLKDQGKLIVRDRIKEICDPGSPFLEFS